MMVQQLAETESSCAGKQGISLVCNYMKKNYLDQRVTGPEDMVLDFFLLFWLYTVGFR